MHTTMLHTLQAVPGQSCAACHNNAGFIDYIETGAVAVGGYSESKPLNCTGCHSVHRSFDFENDGNDYAVRTLDPVDFKVFAENDGPIQMHVSIAICAIPQMAHLDIAICLQEITVMIVMAAMHKTWKLPVSKQTWKHWERCWNKS